uniref:Cell cycle checkpoint control protein RAD9A n=1 Tax=Lygus hesperus TaxID=30085 RepID=A0A0A9WPV6_LYGHE
MKCLVPSQNAKIIARAVNSLAKIGDEVFIECSDDGIVFRTVNIAQSAFVEYRMFRSFFSTYIFDVDDEQDTGCKVTMKSFLSVFKNPHSMDKQVESCEIKMRPSGNVVVFQIKYTNSYVRKYYLPILENERLEANVPDDAPNGLTVSSKFLMSIVKNFRYSEDEVTLTVEKEKTFIKNHLELKRDEHFMRTELCFHPTEFENYSVSNPTSVTFCFKELRAVLAFAEPSGLPIICKFSTPGRPILFKVENHPAYEASYVVSTLNSTNANVESSLIGSQRTSLGSPRNSPRSTTAHRGSADFDFHSDRGDGMIEQQMSMEAEPLPSGSRMQTSQNSLSRLMLPPATSRNVETPEVPGPSTAFPSRIDETTPHSSVHSSYGSSSEIFNNASPVTLSPGPSIPSMPAFSPVEPPDPRSLRLMKIVFARIYERNKNLLDNIPEHNVVLANDSDPEQL